MMVSCVTKCLLLFFSLKVVCGDATEGEEIAGRLGDDLTFASKQFIRGFTSIFAPIVDAAQQGSQRFVPKDQAVGGALQNFHKVLVRDGLNALGKGIKASSTIITLPARVLGTGLDEARKAGSAGLDNVVGPAKSPSKPAKGNAGNIQQNIEDGTKLTSALLNTTSSELSQANFGAILVESALKKRIKDIGNRTTAYIAPKNGKNEVTVETKRETETSAGTGEEPTSPRPVDKLIEQINEAVRSNDQRVLEALREVLKRINPPSQ